MDDQLNSEMTLVRMRKRRVGLMASMACGVAAIAGMGIAGRFDVSIGLDRTWAGPVRFAVNGAVGDDARADGGERVDPAVAGHRPQAGPSNGAPTPADLAEYQAAQEEVASALRDVFRSTAREMDAATADSADSVAAADGESRLQQDTASAMREAAAKLRDNP